MERLEILTKLNKENNFHLSIKTIQITDDDLISKIKESNIEKKIKTLTSLDNAYETLLECYNNKIDVLLVNENIDFLLPIFTVLTKDMIELIKPMIPVYYYLKDNKIIQRVKTNCNKKSCQYMQIKTIDELIDFINKNI